MLTAIKVNDIKQFEVVIGLMLASGKKFSAHRSNETAESYAKSVYAAHPMPLIDETINATYSKDYAILKWPRDAEDIIDIIFSKKYEMPVGDYTAKITEDGIEVGCQNISFETLDSLVKLVENFKNNQ